MKEKILLFIIGLLVGAIISTGIFYVYTKNNSTECETETKEMPNGERPEMPGGENGQPPEMPNGENGEPPAKPGENNTQSNSSSKNS